MRVNGTYTSEVLTGTAQADVFDPGGGSDTINGGGGIDTVLFNTPAFVGGNSVKVDLAAGTAEIKHVQHPKLPASYFHVKLTNVENVTGTEGGSDVLSGNSVANVLDGRHGFDTLSGGGGNDTLLGGRGADTLTGGSGADLLNGGDDVDTAIYSSAAIVDLSAGAAWTASGDDTLSSVENLTMGNGDDWVKGNAAVNFIQLGGGNDIGTTVGSGDSIDGGAGNDALYGSAGADSLYGGDGEDWLEAGGGDDWLYESGKAGEWSAMYGGAGNDHLSIDGANTVGANGGAGNDMFYFNGNGTTYAEGGAGSDTFFMSMGMFAGAGGFAQVSDFQLGVDKIASQMLNVPGFTWTIEDWGPHTGIVFRETGTTHETTLMLLDVDSTKLDAVRDFVTL